MQSELDISTATAGLKRSLTGLITGTRELGSHGSIPKWEAHLSGLETLQEVLHHALKEYQLTLAQDGNGGIPGSSNIDNYDLQNSNESLLRCLRDCDKTCKDYDAILTKILRSKIRLIAWKLNHSALKNVAARLESNKSTLQICLSTISQKRLRIQAAASGNSWSSPLSLQTSYDPPPAIAWDGQLDEKKSPYPPMSTTPDYKMERAPTYEEVENQDETPTHLPANDYPYPAPDLTPDAEKGKEVEKEGPKHSTSQHDPALCVVCIGEESRRQVEEDKERHRNGNCGQYCVVCIGEQSRKQVQEDKEKHARGECGKYCVVCIGEQSTREVKEDKERHARGDCRQYCVVCIGEQSTREVAESKRRHAESL